MSHDFQGLRTIRFRKRRTAILAVSVLAVASAAFAATRIWHYDVERDAQQRETRMNVILKVPYGSVAIYAGARPNLSATIESQSSDPNEPPPMHYRYYYSSVGTIGTLRITLGSDEGMLERKREFAQGSWASSGFRMASAGSIQSDAGATQLIEPFDQKFSPTPAPSPSSSDDFSRVFLNATVPMNLWAETGFGQSLIDITGLSVMSLSVQNNASKSRIVSRSPNAVGMDNCAVNAGLGECVVDGICNFNAKNFKFTGGIGYYELNFTGGLHRDLNANVEVGCGKVVINIPPGSARVQAFYDDNLFSSFTFTGLNKRRDGYFTSVGFDQSRAPILTLRLSTGVGKMVVSYR